MVTALLDGSSIKLLDNKSESGSQRCRRNVKSDTKTCDTSVNKDVRSLTQYKLVRLKTCPRNNLILTMNSRYRKRTRTIISGDSTIFVYLNDK